MLLFGVIRRKQQIILSYTQNSKWNSVCNGVAVFCAAIKGGMGNDGKESDNQRQAARGKNDQNRREADASLLLARVFT
ncbi:hypothetical protein [Aeromonas sp. DNP9]|uniref:hypothetical protein n=1 Tax=Aeromonas sp. DNP9 TaxID=1535548 RepID=UPI00084A829E|nr:hypothetical protein [Aeromonas sp. DNP9]OEC39964.1 hypothetical protein A9G06_12465 [Aeromonas sp. DNP9]